MKPLRYASIPCVGMLAALLLISTSVPRRHATVRGLEGVGAGRRWMGNRGETATNVATKQMRYRDIWEFKGKWRQRDANKKMSMNAEHQNHFVSIGSCLLLVLCGFCQIIFFWYPFGTWWHFLVGWIQGAAHKTWEKSHGKCWQPFTLSVFVTQMPPIP